MIYRWMLNDKKVTDEQLAAFTLANAHRFYEAANVFEVHERDGYIGNGGTESVYREDAFQTAAKHYGVDYDVLYSAWVNEVPVFRCRVASTGDAGCGLPPGHAGNHQATTKEPA